MAIVTTYTQVWDTHKNQVSTTQVQRDIDSAFIPFDDDNSDYNLYKIWLSEGNSPKPITPPGRTSEEIKHD